MNSTHPLPTIPEWHSISADKTRPQVRELSTGGLTLRDKTDHQILLTRDEATELLRWLAARYPLSAVDVLGGLAE